VPLLFHLFGDDYRFIDKRYITDSKRFFLLLFFLVSILWEWVSPGKAPKPVKLSVRTSAWRVMDIRALIQKLDDESKQRND